MTTVGSHHPRHKREADVCRVFQGLVEDRLHQFRRTGRPDRDDASHRGRREKMDRRAAFPARAQFQHADAGAGGAEARDLYRLAAAWRARRADRRNIVRAARRAGDAGPQPALRARTRLSGDRRRLVRHQGGRAGNRRRSADPHRQACAQDVATAWHCRSGLCRHLLLCPAVSDHCHCCGFNWLSCRAIVAGLDRTEGRCRRCSRRPRPTAGGRRDCRGGRPRCLVGAGRARSRAIRPEPRPGQRRIVLLEARRRQLRRRLRIAGLHGAAGGRDASLDDRARNGRRAGPCGNHPRAADPGDAIRRVPRGLPRRRRRSRRSSPAFSPPR